MPKRASITSASQDPQIQGLPSPAQDLLAKAALEERQQLVVELPVSLHRAFKVAVAMQGDRMADVVRKAVKSYVAKAGV